MEQHKIHYFGHIINLIVAIFIYQKITNKNLPAENDDDE